MNEMTGQEMLDKGNLLLAASDRRDLALANVLVWRPEVPAKASRMAYSMAMSDSVDGTKMMRSSA
jgi:hypothetical protein